MLVQFSLASSLPLLGGSRGVPIVITAHQIDARRLRCVDREPTITKPRLGGGRMVMPSVLQAASPISAEDEFLGDTNVN